jgi:catechol 2,3-dioxygenase-like lactoylglutathione lyase family enzyme
MPRTGFIDHIGIGVPDLAAAKQYYDELMPILGLRAWFATTEAGEFNYGPDGARGSQIFFYQALEPGRAWEAGGADGWAEEGAGAGS